MQTNNLDKVKNNAINYYKIIFIIIVALHHTNWCTDWLKRGYIGVEFFFIISGYFMFKTYLKKLKYNYNISSLEYTKKRLIKLYPHYIFSFLIIYFVTYRGTSFSISNIIRSIPEILLVQNIGIFQGGINYPMWYLSVLIIGGFFIYDVLNRFGIKTTSIISLFCITVVYVYLIFINHKLEDWSTVYIFYLPFWRGVADIYIGILIGILNESFKNVLIINKYLLYTFEIISIIGILISLTSNLNFDFIAIIFIIILLICVLNSNSISRKLLKWKWIDKLIKVQYAIYLNHALVIKLFNFILKYINVKPNTTIIALYIVILIFYSVVTSFIVDRIVYSIRKFTFNYIKVV